MTKSSDIDFLKLQAEYETKLKSVSYGYTTTTTTGPYTGGIGGTFSTPPYKPLLVLPTPVPEPADLKGSLVLLGKDTTLIPAITNAVVVHTAMSREEKIKIVSRWLADNE